MKVTYSNSVEKLSSDQLNGFFIGWPNHPNQESHLQILKKSYAVWIALHQNSCVGFINALSDDVFYAHIPLLEVLPKYQGYGVGKELVQRMLNTLEGMYAIDIICDETLVPFYHKFGLKKNISMIMRNYKNQGVI
tara:strand:+ start:119 stop:523 length:405 start_codon:yes stop_codon:yes gene_type:complete